VKSDETCRSRWKTERKSQKTVGGTRDRRASSCPRIGLSILPCSPLAPAKVSLLCISQKWRVMVIENNKRRESETEWERERGDMTSIIIVTIIFKKKTKMILVFFFFLLNTLRGLNTFN